VKPALGEVLSAMSARLAGDILPLLPAGYAQSDALVLALLAAGAAEEQERAADVRMADIRELQSVLALAGDRLDGSDLQPRVAQVCRCEPASLRVSDLDACLDRLHGALIELHAFVEGRSEPWALELNDEVWRYLRASVGRRAMATNPF
jgi:hypothetical protein